MPELPEVETARLGLLPVLQGARLTRVEQRAPKLRWDFPDNFAERLGGRRVERLERRAKYLLWHLDDGAVLIAHLGMTGSFRIFGGAYGPAPGPGKHDHAVFQTDGGHDIYFCDPRKFGMMVLSSANELPGHPLLAEIGPEPLGGDFTPEVLARRLAGRSGPIKTVLMDQKVVAGIGNIYASEALFRAGISPRRKASSVKGRRAEKLVEGIKTVLRDAIRSGGSSLRDHRQANGESGYFQHHFAVYGKTGEACPGCDCSAAGDGIRQFKQAGRSTFYCPSRQR
ncbi:MAG: bifunctional DNA-formamidopyrimidine glycosylase/DNA-(apurinic or apyrimidinic site) lyase [Rhodospirillales bacterium]|nr:bifunctional DNA-formamidopyrimidine glycosylase/DNA-(apurinic or apyrimidinic site) lyase [Rhodospirillales bacterium]